MFLSEGALVSTKTPLSLTAGSSWFSHMPPMSARNWPTAYGGMYSRQLWVYVVVSKLAKATARLPLPVYEHNDQDRPRADNHPMGRLLANPNPAMSGFELKRWTSSTEDIHGEAVWLKQRDRREQVANLYPLHPTGLSLNDDGRTWRFDNGTLILRSIAPEDLVWFKSFHPDSLTRGLSPLEPLRATLENEWHARTATSSFWQRGARPGMALSHPKTLSAPAQERLKAQMDAVAAGSDKTGVTIVLEEGMEPKPMTLTAEEAQYIETRKLNREEVCAAYDVPPPVVHILDHATFSNITEQMRSMYRDTMAPRLAEYEATVDLHLRQVEWPSDSVYAEFLMDEVLRGDFEKRQEALKSASHMTIAEKRKIENLPFIEGTDRIFLNAAEVPMSAPDNGDAPAAPPFQQVGLPALVAAGVLSEQDARDLLGVPGTAPGLPAITAPVSRSIMGRLSWQKSITDIDVRSLVADLGPATVPVLRVLDEELASGGDVTTVRARIRSMVEV